VPLQVTRVESATDPTVAEYRRLNDASFRRGIEQPGSFGGGLVVIEGWLPLERALGGPHRLRSILVDERRLGRLEQLVAAAKRHHGATALVASPAVIESIVGFDLHRGVVATIDRPRARNPVDVVRRSRRLVVVEGVTDTENVGVLFRNAAALGADGVVVDTTTADPWSRRAVRTSVGHVLSVPWAVGSTELLSKAVADAGHLLVAMTPDGEVDLADVDLADVAVPDGRAVAVAVGAEGPGLSPGLLDAAEVRARIGMARGVDSINVASAAAIAAWHLFRRAGLP